ncbi:uncharacterized protein LOC134272732 [Saccostrea cucullata]|uniref:uncharacterized protein LOC134272732 n=1 Tax=Saccostrea cuccullata TaxID=36930 RepID=UPI002ED00FDF
MGARQAKMKKNLGSKRKGSSSEETGFKRKILKCFFTDEADDESEERDISVQNLLTRNANKVEINDLADINVLITTGFEIKNNDLADINDPVSTDKEIKNSDIADINDLICTDKELENTDLADINDLISTDNEIENKDLADSQEQSSSKTEYNNDDDSRNKSGDEEKNVEKRAHTIARIVEEHALLKLEEEEFETINTDDESNETISETSIQIIDEEKDVEQKPDEYVYRILRFNETYHNGLRPKNIFSRISLQQHVERGSKGQESRFISCCKTLYGIERLGSLTNEFQRIRQVVRINITKLKDRARVIDLTKEEIRERHISRYSAAWGYAERFEEVIIDPTSCVPSECVEKIGVVHMRSFIKR